MSSVRTKPAEPMAPASLTIVGAVAPPRSEARLVGATQEAWRARFQTWDGLMAAAQAGDSVAYARLLHELDRWLRRYYGRRLSAAAAEDAKQEAMLAIHTARQTFVSSRSFSAWALAIARYKLMDCFLSLIHI